MKIIIFLLLSVPSFLMLNAQVVEKELFSLQPQYTVLKTTDKISIDGVDNETVWSIAPWTNFFTDIKTGIKGNPQHLSRARMLWDDDYLYMYIKFPETDIWATLKKHDTTVFQDNAFELFIDHDGDRHNYMEFQINALGTVWDLMLTKPYRNGGRSISDWDIKGLRKAIHLDGTLNDAGDKDNFWSIELAFPLKSISFGQGVRMGDVWRMNLSRVQWDLETKKGVYMRKRDERGMFLPPNYSAWSPQGIINFHYPERWGYVMFGDKVFSSDFLDIETERIKLSLWHCYYLQNVFKSKYSRFANSMLELKNEFSELDTIDLSNVTLSGNVHQFLIEYSLASVYIALDHDGKNYYK